MRKVKVNRKDIANLCNWKHEYFGIFASFLDDLCDKDGYITVEGISIIETEPLLGYKLDMLGLSNRIKFVLKDHGIHNVDALLKMTPEDTGKLPGIGEVALREIETAIKEYNLNLENEDPRINNSIS